MSTPNPEPRSDLTALEDLATRAALVAFLLARIVEDERAAKRAMRAVAHRDDPAGEQRWRGDNVGLYVGHTAELVGPQGSTDERLTAHVARHDPARVLAECETKRRIITEIVPRLERMDVQGGPDTDDAGHLLRLLAAPYEEHPDWWPEWLAYEPPADVVQ